MVASSSSKSSVPRRPDISLPSGSFSRVSLQTRFADITGASFWLLMDAGIERETGTYYIEPKNVTELVSRRKKRKNKIKHIPDAVFRTKRGNITLDLATTGHANEVAKASVVASTKSGNISLNLISGAETRPRFDLEANTRSGECGCIFRKGEILRDAQGTSFFLFQILFRAQYSSTRSEEILIFSPGSLLECRS
jgi:hypothetical protein